MGLFNVGEGGQIIEEYQGLTIAKEGEGDITEDIMEAITKNAIHEAIKKADIERKDQAVEILKKAEDDISAYPESQAKAQNINKLLDAMQMIMTFDGDAQASLRNGSQSVGRSLSYCPQ